jgi:hypothetical protein
VTEIAYGGSKWGPFLRAPDLYFELLNEAGSRCVQLGSIADISYGIKTGADSFFYLRDVTEATLRRRNATTVLRDQFALTKEELQRRRLALVRGLGNVVTPVERRFLKPVIFNLMEVDRIRVDADTARRLALVVEVPRPRLKRTAVADYIAHGERHQIDERPTCASRVTTTREWYELRPPVPATILWSQAHQYRHIVPYNPEHCLHNKRFFSIHMSSGVDDRIGCAVLNSTFVCFFKLYLGRVVGREGIIDTDVSAVEELWVPDPRRVEELEGAAVLEAFDSMCDREIQPLPPRGDELDQLDRQALDEAVLRACGVANAGVVRRRLYDEVAARLTETRELEEIAMENRARAARVGRGPNAGDIATEIIDTLGISDPMRFPDDFFSRTEGTETVVIPDGQPEVGTGLFTDSAGSTATGSVRFGEHVVDVEDHRRAEFLAEMARVGIRGEASIPVNPEVCAEAIDGWEAYRIALTERMDEAVGDRTGNERLQRRVLGILRRQVFHRA